MPHSTAFNKYTMPYYGSSFDDVLQDHHNAASTSAELNTSPTLLAQGSQIANGADVALSEFRRALSEPSIKTATPLMLISTLLNSYQSATQSISASSFLLGKFGTLGNLLSRTYAELNNCSDLDSNSLILLRAVRELLVLVLREPIESGPLLSSNEALHAYLKFTMAHDRVEAVKLLFLNGQNRLIRDEIHATGTVNFVTVHPREVLRRAIEIDASALIIVHNHPGGDATPSTDDVEMTRTLKFVLEQVGVMLHDHVIVGASCCCSMKAMALI